MVSIDLDFEPYWLNACNLANIIYHYYYYCLQYWKMVVLSVTGT